MALALIPIEMLQEGINIILKDADNLDEKQVEFVEYFVDQWCNAKQSKQRPAIWNQHLATMRMNNTSEGNHSSMGATIPRHHPTVAMIVTYFKDCDSVASDKFLKYNKNIVTSSQKRADPRRDDLNLSIELTHIEYFDQLKEIIDKEEPERLA